MAERRRRFTLIEVIVAIAIVGLLVGIAWNRLSVARTHAFDDQQRNTLSLIVKAQEQYKSQTAFYAPSLDALAFLTGLEVDHNVRVTINSVDTKYGYEVFTTHEGTDTQCSVWYGSVGPGERERSGKIRCSDDGVPMEY